MLRNSASILCGALSSVMLYRCAETAGPPAAKPVHAAIEKLKPLQTQLGKPQQRWVGRTE